MLGVFLLAGAAGYAQQALEKPPTPEALLGLRRLSDPEFSPDGTHVAFVVTEAPKGEEGRRHIWLFETSSGSLRQLTFSDKAESWPRW